MLIINSVLPGIEFTFISPLWWLITFFTISSPIPVPSPTFFVVKKGSKIRENISLRNTGPVVCNPYCYIFFIAF